MYVIYSHIIMRRLHDDALSSCTQDNNCTEKTNCVFCNCGLINFSGDFFSEKIIIIVTNN